MCAKALSIRRQIVMLKIGNVFLQLKFVSFLELEKILIRG
jgi:hypothetical protein